MTTSKPINLKEIYFSPTRHSPASLETPPTRTFKPFIAKRKPMRNLSPAR